MIRNKSIKGKGSSSPQLDPFISKLDKKVII